MWVQMLKPNGKRLLLNMDQIFCFDEQDDGNAAAVSITGVAAPSGMTMDDCIEQIMAEVDRG